MLIWALSGKADSFSFKKAMVYFCSYCIYSFVFNHFQLPPLWSITSYILLFGYICWAYPDLFIRNLLKLVFTIVGVSIIELLLTQILYWICPVELKPGILEVLAATFMVILCFSLRRISLYKVMDYFDKWEPAYALVAVLSLMIVSPLVILRVIKKLEVTEYVYITSCVIAMWLLLSKIQKYSVENRIRKKYLESFSDIITQIRRRQHKVKNQFNTAFGLYRLYDNYDELVEKQKEYLGRLWDYELPTDAIILEEPIIVALLYEKINEAIESGIEVETVFSCSMLNRNVADVIWVQILGTLLDNAIEALQGYGESKKLWIEIEEENSSGGKLSISIANTYRKMKQSEMEKIFEFGYSTKGEGRGVGLYDVKQLIYRNKGDLIIDNAKKDGLDCLRIQIIL